MSTWAQAVQMLELVLARVQSMHMWGSTTNSITKVCCRMAPFMTSAWMVSFTLMRRECGSVHTKPASTSFTWTRGTSFQGLVQHHTSRWAASIPVAAAPPHGALARQGTSNRQLATPKCLCCITHILSPAKHAGVRRAAHPGQA